MSAWVTRGPHRTQQHEQSYQQLHGPQLSSIEPITLRVPEACRYLGIGRSTLYVLIAQGEVEIVKLGSATLVLTESLRSLIEQRRQPGREQTSPIGQ